MTPKKILIIEDEEMLLDVIAKKLSNENYNVVLAHDGEEGIKKIESEKPDLILLDIIMPKINGYEVLEEMTRTGSIKTIPVIVISNSGQSVEIEKIIKLGVKDYLIKTEFSPQEVVEKIKKQIGE